nr:hypothetical protein [Marinicella sp. W31]MDC2879386.1 hypothetical protein [Marinicella sp. W31]
MFGRTERLQSSVPPIETACAMTEIKSYKFDEFLRQGLSRYKLFLLYGPDRGLVSERAGLIAKGTGVALDDPFSVMKLDVGDIEGDAGRIVDEVNSIGLLVAPGSSGCGLAAMTRHWQARSTHCQNCHWKAPF